MGLLWQILNPLLFRILAFCKSTHSTWQNRLAPTKAYAHLNKLASMGPACPAFYLTGGELRHGKIKGIFTWSHSQGNKPCLLTPAPCAASLKMKRWRHVWHRAQAQQIDISLGHPSQPHFWGWHAENGDGCVGPFASVARLSSVSR